MNGTVRVARSALAVVSRDATPAAISSKLRDVFHAAPHVGKCPSY